VWIQELNLSGWRNHVNTKIEFDEGTTTFIGPNGQGKTNIVEAIRYLATLGSHRVTGSTALINDDAGAATIHAQLRHQERTVSIGITVKRKGATEAVLNGNKAKPTELPHWVSMVMFAPEDSAIVRGEPGFRRTFMDELVTSASPMMAGTYQDFDRVLRQRNTLLKSLRPGSRPDQLGTLDVWDENFAKLSAHIIQSRTKYLAAILPSVNLHYATLAGGDQVEALYVSSATPADQDHRDEATLSEKILQKLGEKRSEEIDRGITLVGPQRDDLVFTISGKPARTHASQGETWSLALSLRLATAAWLRQELSSGDPIIILDDVFAELDATRRRMLVSLVSDYSQILVTSAVEEDLPEGLSGNVLDVHDGVVTPR
jgi:DNA replication and repair protein RecF